MLKIGSAVKCGKPRPLQPMGVPATASTPATAPNNFHAAEIISATAGAIILALLPVAPAAGGEAMPITGALKDCPAGFAEAGCTGGVPDNVVPPRFMF